MNIGNFGNWTLVVFATICVFVFDLSVPLGVAAGVLYAVVALSAFSRLNFRSTMTTAAICTICISAGGWLSQGNSSWHILLNRAMSIIAVWTVVFVAAIATRKNRGTWRHGDSKTRIVDQLAQGDFDDFEIAPESAARLFENIRRSQIFCDETVDRIAAKFDSFPPSTIVRKLVEENVLSRYQATMIFHGKTERLVFGNYVVTDRIGQGGVGEVFKAKDSRTNDLVAIKTIITSQLTRRSVLRFQREVEAFKKLSHVNLLQVLESNLNEDSPFLVTEYIDGKHIGEMVAKEGPFEFERAYEIACQIANGMDYVHSNSVIHRDLKPSNLMIDKQGCLKILDLGLARELREFKNDDDDLTRVGDLCGTLDYMAPEQAIDAHASAETADIFSFGASLYFLLTGETLMTRKSVEQKVRELVEGNGPYEARHAKKIPSPFRPLLKSMLQRNPGLRIQSMQQIKVELDAMK